MVKLCDQSTELNLSLDQPNFAQPILKEGLGRRLDLIFESDFISDLVKKKKQIIAVRCICDFGLSDKYPVGYLLADHIQDANQLATSISWRPGPEAKFDACEILSPPAIFAI
ncbi:Frigida-like [Dillenia turbinata]|uniref:FRIGIDA-like protein n=1 Tax=Dillenia turbinata TaxID=194707 RepID=A0AAN8URF1_9MAGN